MLRIKRELEAEKIKYDSRQYYHIGFGQQVKPGNDRILNKAFAMYLQ